MSDYPFDPYDLQLSLYDDRLVSYAIGRLLRRLEWHQVQWLVLEAENCCEHPLPEEWAAEDGDASDGWCWQQEKDDVLFLQQEVKRESGRQRDLAGRVRDQLLAAVRELPTQASVPLRRKVGKICEELFAPDWLAFEKEARELAEDLRMRFRLEEYFLYRTEMLEAFLTPRSMQFLDQMQQLLLDSISDVTRPYLELGCVIEEGLCRRDVWNQMSLCDHRTLLVRRLVERGNKFIGLTEDMVLGFCAFAPGALPLRTWRANCKAALDVAGLAGEAVLEVLPPSPLLSPKYDDTAATRPFNMANEVSFCRWPAIIQVVEKVGRLHDALMAEEESRRTGSSGEIRKPKERDFSAVAPTFDVELKTEPSGGMLLTRKGKEPVSISRAAKDPLRILQAIINMNGAICTYDILLKSDQSRKSLHTAIHRLNETIMNKAGLELKNCRGEGYSLAEEAEVQPAPKRSSRPRRSGLRRSPPPPPPA